ncbi:MAG TPA: hypothetical protein P5016_12985 [Verrucomicrobiales bacterium]|nr:hypothetical protein [Verrucomicrobiales bacterium]
MKLSHLLLALAVACSAPFAQCAPPADSADFSALKNEIERLKGLVPDQSHAMKDVAYHFTNLWFAGQQENWPLAEFYLAESRSHLRWAVRIIPIRKTPQGQEFKLADLLEPMEKTVLKDLQGAIASKDIKTFRSQYELTLNSCYACHVTAGKPFLRLQIPLQPEVQIIRFDPAP